MRTIGFNLGLNTTGFLEKVRVATRSLASMEYVAGRTSKKMGHLSSAFETVGYASGAGLVIGAAAAFEGRALYEAIIAPAVEQAVKFDVEMQQLYYLSGLKAGDALSQGLKEKITNAALFSSLNPAQVTSGINELIKTGVSATDAQQMIKPLIDVVQGSFGKLDTATAGKTMGLLALKFKRPQDSGVAEWTQHLADMSFQLAEMTHLDMGQITSLLGSMSSAPALAEMTSAEDFFGLAAASLHSSNTSMRSGRGISQFSQMLLQVQANLKSKKGGAAAKEGLDTLHMEFDDLLTMGPDGQKKFKSIPKILALMVRKREDMIAEFAAAGKDISTAELEWRNAVKGLFGREIGVTMTEFVRSLSFDAGDGKILKGVEALDAIIAKLGNSTGKAAEAAEAYRASWKGIFEEIQGAYETFMSLIGDEILGFFANAIKGTRSWLADTVLLVQSNKQLAEAIALIAISLTGMAMGLTVIMGTLAFISMTIIFMVPGFLALASNIASMVRQVVRLGGAWKDATDAARKNFAETRSGMSDTIRDLKNAIKHEEHMVALLREEGRLHYRSKGWRNALDLHQGSLGPLTTALGTLTSSASVLGVVTILLGVLAIATYFAVMGFAALAIGALVFFRVMSDGEKRTAWLDGMVARWRKLVVTGKALLELFKDGSLSDETKMGLEAEGAVGDFEKLVNIGWKIKRLFDGMFDGLDFEFLDSAIARVGVAFDRVFGTTEDGTIDSADNWYKFGKVLGLFIQAAIIVAAVVLFVFAAVLELNTGILRLTGGAINLGDVLLVLAAAITLATFAFSLLVFVIGSVFLVGFMLLTVLGGAMIAFSMLSLAMIVFVLVAGAAFLFLMGVIIFFPVIMAAAIVGVLIYFREAWMQAFSDLASGIGYALDDLKPIGERIAKVFTDPIDWVKNKWAEADLWSQVKAAGSQLIADIKAEWDSFNTNVVQNVSDFGSGLVAGFDGLVEAIKIVGIVLGASITAPLFLALTALDKITSHPLWKLKTHRSNPMLPSILGDLFSGGEEGTPTGETTAQATPTSTTPSGFGIPEPPVPEGAQAKGLVDNSTTTYQLSFVLPPETPVDQISAEVLAKIKSTAADKPDRGYYSEFT